MVYKRGDTYWYEFRHKGERVRESTHQENRQAAIATTITSAWRHGCLARSLLTLGTIHQETVFWADSGLPAHSTVLVDRGGWLQWPAKRLKDY